jgi:hypothetical protein
MSLHVIGVNVNFNVNEVRCVHLYVHSHYLRNVNH